MIVLVLIHVLVSTSAFVPLPAQGICVLHEVLLDVYDSVYCVYVCSCGLVNSSCDYWSVIRPGV